MNLYHIKMENGTDILGIINDEDFDEETVTIHTPVEFSIHMEHGPFLQSFLFLSQESSVRLRAKFIMFVHPASEKGIAYFNKFMEQMSAKYNEEAEAEDMHEASDEPELTFEDVKEALDLKAKKRMH